MHISSFCLIIIVLATMTFNVFAENSNGELQRQKRGYYRCGGWWGQTKWCYRCDKYDKNTKICCHPYSYGCCKQPHLFDKPICNNAQSYHADPCSCNDFYQCYSGTLSHFFCPFRSAWDENDKTCRKVMNNEPTFCGERPYKKQVLPAFFVNVNFLAVNGNTNVASFAEDVPTNDVYNIMVHLKGARDDFDFTTTFFQPWWYSVSCINGVCSNNERYWSFLVDGTSPNLGISSVVAKKDMEIKFVLTNITQHD